MPVFPDMQALLRAAPCRVAAAPVCTKTRGTTFYGHKPTVRQLSRSLHLSHSVSASPSAKMAASLSDSISWPAIRDRYDAALQTGAITRTETENELFRDPALDVLFVLRVASALRRKPASTSGTGEDSNSNPFLDPDEALVVGDVSPTHSLLLNKFNVVRLRQARFVVNISFLNFLRIFWRIKSCSRRYHVIWPLT